MARPLIHSSVMRTKRGSRSVPACALLIVATALEGGAAAQTSPPSAATVLGNIQQYYATASHLTAQFRQVVTNVAYSQTRKSDGKLWVAKPALFRVDYLAQAHGVVTVSKTFAFDGTTLWLVDHQNKEVLESTPQGSVLPAAVSFLTGGSGLATQFNVVFDASGKFGGSGAVVLQLTPKQPSAQYKQVFFVVDPSNWHVSASIVVDSNGDTNEFDFYSPDLTSPVKNSWFQVSPTSVPTYKHVLVGNGGGSGSGSAQASPSPAPQTRPTPAGSGAAPMSRP
jgi:outer membrane lipoprotein-sorting protein